MPEIKLPLLARKYLPLLFSLLFILSLVVNIILWSMVKDKEEGYRVIAVLDGDTVLLEGDTRIRLRTIDAPELYYCGGKEAKSELEKLVSGKRVTLAEQIIDAYGRPLALVYTGKILVNEKMLSSGWARFHNDVNTQKVPMKAAYDKARSENLGIFSPKCRQTVNPDNPKCNIKGNTDKSTGTRIYYFPGCAQYEFTVVEKDIGEQFFCSEQEVQSAGYIKSKNCRKN